MEKSKKENFKGNLKVNSIELKDFKFFFYCKILIEREGNNSKSSKTHFEKFSSFSYLKEEFYVRK